MDGPLRTEFEREEIAAALRFTEGFGDCSSFVMHRFDALPTIAKDAGGLTLREAARVLVGLDGAEAEQGRLVNEERREWFAKRHARYADLREGRVPGGLAQIRDEFEESGLEIERRHAERQERTVTDVFRALLPPDRFARWAQARATRQREIERQEAEARARVEAANAAAEAAKTSGK